MISVTKGGEAVLERCPRFGSLCVSETSTTPYTDATQVIGGKIGYHLQLFRTFTFSWLSRVKASVLSRHLQVVQCQYHKQSGHADNYMTADYHLLTTYNHNVGTGPGASLRFLQTYYVGLKPSRSFLRVLVFMHYYVEMLIPYRDEGIQVA